MLGGTYDRELVDEHGVALDDNHNLDEQEQNHH